MSLAQFSAFPPPPSSSLPRSSPPSSQSQMSAPSPASAHRQCCENGRPILTDPHTGQTVCSCQYPPPGAALITSPFPPGPRGGPGGPPPPLPPGLESVYNASAFAAAASQGYVGLGAEGSAFYSPLGTSPYDLKESAEAWRTLAASQPGFPYDPMALYPYGPGKNATRENTNTLKAWLFEHRKNPYPTKGEKIMLAIITKMTLTQVSTWFANARRRLKKENKMTWSPRNRSEDGSDDIDNNDDDDDGGAGGEGSRRRDIMTPTHDLDMTSSKPSSPLLSPDSDHPLSRHRPPLKERIIRVDVDEDDDDDDDYDNDEAPRHLHGDNNQDMETSVDSFRSRHRLLSPHHDFRESSVRPLFASSSLSRDRSPLRDDSSKRSSSSSGSHLNSTTPGHEHSDRRSPMSNGDSRKSPVTSLQRPGVTSPASSCASVEARRSTTPSAVSPRPASPPASSSTATTTPTTTKPKIWSISDVINSTSSSSSSTSSSASSVASSSHHQSPSAIVSSSSGLSSSLLSSPTSHPHSRGPPSFLPPPPSSPHQRVHSGGPHQPGFFFLPPGAHWPHSAAAAAAAARFGFGGAAYPLALSHPSLSYSYGLGQPGSAAVAAAAVAATRAGLEAQAQAAHLAAAARAAAQAAEGGAASSRVSQREDTRLSSPHASTAFSRLESARALFSPGREADGVRPQALAPPPRMVVDSSI